MTIQGVTEQWIVKEFTLGIEPFNTSHTGANIVQFIATQIEAWGLKKAKIFAIATDGAKNFSKVILYNF